LNGRMLLEKACGLKKRGEHAEMIDVSLLQPGNYWYVITVDGAEFGTGKLMKL